MAPSRKKSKADQARQYLKGGGVIRDDSDDELGVEDHPWEWIYADHGQDGETDPKSDSTPVRRMRKGVDQAASKQIVGARMGNFSCQIGDTVLLKADGNEAWVGLISDLFEDEEEGDKMANFMWFSTPKEIRNRMKKRNDAFEVSRLKLRTMLDADQCQERTLYHAIVGQQSINDHQWQGCCGLASGVRQALSWREDSTHLKGLRQSLYMSAGMQHPHCNIYSRLRLGGRVQWTSRHSSTNRHCQEPNQGNTQAKGER